MSRASRVGVLCVANFVLATGITAILPLLPDLQERNGLTTGQLGLVAGISFLAGVVGQLGLARFVDRGHARLLLLTSAVVTAAALVGVALSGGMWDLLAARFAEGLGYSLFVPAARAVVAADDPTRVGERLGLLSGAELTGILVGPLLGTLLAEAWGLAAPFLVLAVAVAALLPLFASIELSVVGRATSRARTAVRELLRRPGVARAALLQVALVLPSGVYDVLWARYLTDLGASRTFVGVSFTIYAAPYVLVSAFGARVIDRIGAVPAAVAGLVGVLPTMVLYGLLGRPGVVATVAVLEGAANAIGVPAAQAAMVAACDRHEIGTGQGVAGAAGIGAAGVAAAAAAPVYEAFGVVTAFSAAAVTVAAIGALGLWVGRRAVSPAESG